MVSGRRSRPGRLSAARAAAPADVPRPERTGDVWRHDQVRLSTDRHGTAVGTLDWLRGVVISVQSVGMLVFIPIMGVVADRFGAHRLVVVTGRWGRAPTSASWADSELGLIAATVLNSAMRATLGGSAYRGRRPVPKRDGMASSLYFSALGSLPRSAASPARWELAGSASPGVLISACCASWPRLDL